VAGALGISFGVVIAKEVFGGTGMNFINPALAARAFLFFAYPAEISGDKVCGVPEQSRSTASQRHRAGAAAPVDAAARVDGCRGGTPSSGWSRAAWARLGAGLPDRRGDPRAHPRRLVADDGRVALGTVGMSLLFNALASSAHPYFAIPSGGTWCSALAFGTAFMPPTGDLAVLGPRQVDLRAADRRAGRAGANVNPAYPESMMLVILFMNVMAPLIDYPIVRANINRRLKRRRELNPPLHVRLRCGGVCGLRAAGAVAAVGLREKQETNARLYRQKNVLLAAGLVKPGRIFRPRTAGDLRQEHTIRWST